MRWIVKFNGEVLGSVLTNRSMTDEEICEMAGVELARTEEDYDGAPENGKYIFDDLDIIEYKEGK